MVTNSDDYYEITNLCFAGKNTLFAITRSRNILKFIIY
jgi:hypothetical protein